MTSADQVETAEGPHDEAARLAAVRSYATLDTHPAPRIDDLVRLASHVVGTPMAGLCLVEADRVVWKAAIGFSLEQTPREGSFCAETILHHDDVFVVPDATIDPRFAEQPLVTGPPHVRFYAGVPLLAQSGHRIGTLSVFDSQPRELQPEQAQALRALARAAMAQFGLLRSVDEITTAAAERDRAKEALKRSNDILQSLSRAQSDFIGGPDPDACFRQLLAILLEVTGSTFGFVSEIVRPSDQEFRLETRALTAPAWSEEARRIYTERLLETSDPATLTGSVVATAWSTICNQPASDPRATGLIECDPPLKTFLAVPLFTGAELAGVVGLANRPDGYSEELIDELTPVIFTCGSLLGALRQERQRRQAEEALRRERDLVARIAATSPAGITVTEPGGQIVFANDRAEQILGQSRDEIAKRRYDAPEWRITDFEGRPVPAERLPVRQVLGSKSPVFGVHHAIEWPDGKRVLLSVNAAPIQNAEGEIEAVVSTIEDVTSAARALEALHVTRDAVSSSLSGMVFADQAGRLTDVNAAFLRLWGYPSSDEVTGRLAWEFWDDTAQVRAMVESLQPQRGWSGELKARRKDGSTFEVQTAASLILDGHGHPVGMMASFIDLTTQKRVERTVRRVVEGASAEVGEHYLDAIVLQLAQALEMDFIFVGELVHGGPPSVKTLAFCADGAVATPFVYQLKGTPCETVMGRHACTYPVGVRHLFPEDKALFDLDVDGYIGVPLFSTEGGPLGVMVALSRRPIANPEFAAAILSLFASRTAAEIERTRALKDLERSERLSRSIVESIPVGMHMYRLEADGRLVFAGANPAADRLLRTDHRQFVGKAIEEAFPGVVGTELPAAFRAAAAEGKPWRADHVIYEYEGAPATALVEAFQTAPDRMVAAFLNITERKQAEDALRESEERLRTIYHSANDAILLIDPASGALLDVNPAMCEMSGYSMEELRALTAGDLCPDEAPYTAADTFAWMRKAQGGEPQRFEWKSKGKGGRLYWVDINMRSVQINGRDRLMVVARDVTERKRAAEALRESEERYRSFIVNTSEAIWRIEWVPPIPVDLSPQEHARLNFERAVVAECNDVFARQYGAARAEDVVGKRYSELIPNPDPSFFEFLTEFAARGFQISGLETEETDPTGRTHFFTNNVVGIVKDGCLHRAWGTQADITERKQAERALRESEERYRKLVDQSAYGTALIVEGRVAFANPAAARIFGAENPTEVIGRDMMDFLRPGAGETVRERFARAARGETNAPIEFLARRLDRSTKWVETTSTALTFGGRLAYQIMIRDLTEEKHAQARLTTQATVTQILAEATDLADAIPRVLEAVCGGLGWDAGELWAPDPAADGQLTLRGRHGPSVLPPASPSSLSADERSLPGHVWVSREAHWIPDLTTAGDTAWKASVDATGLRSAAAFPVKGARGANAVLVFLSRESRPLDQADFETMTDIGQRVGQFFERQRVEVERERLQDAVQRAALEWRLTFDAVETVIVILDGAGDVVRLNSAAQRTSGLSFDQVLGRPIGKVAPAEPWPTAAIVASAAAREQAARAAHIRDPIEGRSWEVMAAPFAGPEGLESRVIVVAQDVTRTVELQESVRRAETMAAMGSLVAGVAHEVRNPLFALSTNVDALEATITDRTGLEEIIEALRRSVGRLSKLMEDLLEYGRTSGAALTPGALPPVVGLALKSCAPLAQSRGVTLVNTLDGMDFRVAMDRDRLEQVFENLVENAVYHSPPGGRVLVEAEAFSKQDRPWVRVLVSDEGPGFHEEDLPRVFQPFFSRRRGGTGLGLSIVERIIQAHEGKVMATNRPGHGAVLIVELPCAN